MRGDLHPNNVLATETSGLLRLSSVINFGNVHGADAVCEADVCGVACMLSAFEDIMAPSSMLDGEVDASISEPKVVYRTALRTDRL